MTCKGSVEIQNIYIIGYCMVFVFSLFFDFCSDSALNHEDAIGYIVIGQQVSVNIHTMQLLT